MKTTSLAFLLLAMSWLFSSSCNQLSKKHNETNAPDTVAGPVITDSADNLTAMDLHEKLMTSFSEDWVERESDPDLYPDYYGGSFIDNNGTFVITVTGDREQNSQRLIAILGTDNFNVETVQYSYKQMMQVMDRIDAFLINTSIPDDHPVMAHFAGAYPDVMDNRVKVVLTVVRKEITDAFQRDISNSPMVVFEQGEMPQMF